MHSCNICSAVHTYCWSCRPDPDVPGDLCDQAELVQSCLIYGAHLVEDKSAGQQHRQGQQVDPILSSLQQHTRSHHSADHSRCKRMHGCQHCCWDDTKRDRQHMVCWDLSLLQGARHGPINRRKCLIYPALMDTQQDHEIACQT